MINKLTLISLIAESLEVDEADIDENASNETIEEWDSLGHLSILSALDDLTDGKASELNGLADSLSLNDLIKTLSAAGLINS
jgi:acyl carrier protein|tara:strand:+ start:1349 stop:1594 length:246 start_codon:yes stop_codon:yes gene_type:complete